MYREIVGVAYISKTTSGGQRAKLVCGVAEDARWLLVVTLS